MVQNITNPHGKTSIFITLMLKEGEQSLEVIRDFCDRLVAIENSLKLRYPESRFGIIFGIGSKAWDRLFPGKQKPKELTEFQPIQGPKREAVATDADLFFQIKGFDMDVCYEAARLINELLRDVCDPVDETHGFRYFDGRAIIGFVDGTENPADEEALEDGYVSDEDPFFKGGSYAFAQKYEHDMDFWNGLSVEEQEKSIGRRKMDDLELADDQKLKNAHTVISKAYRNGDEAKIIRANTPYAEPSKNLFGTYFVGYAGMFSTTLTMLHNMYKGVPEGNYDRLLDFSKPVTGNVFSVPAPSLLDKIASGEF